MKKNKTQIELRDDELQGNISINEYQEISDGYSVFDSQEQFLNSWAAENSTEQGQALFAKIVKAQYLKRKKDGLTSPFVLLSLEIPAQKRFGSCSVHFTALGLKGKTIFKTFKNGLKIAVDCELPELKSIINRECYVIPNKQYFSFIDFLD